ncbi:calmodulin-4, partial [Eurytemora carolleeae]|uniref:calmodulin-4 n=1 Tax=Eurytemora carolleeae TaxID=1294199 RepID=UPI000C765FBA
DLFNDIDEEDDQEVYMREVVIHVRALNDDIDKNIKVKLILDEFDTHGDVTVNFKQFCIMMDKMKEAGWKHCNSEDLKREDAIELDAKAIFKMIDVNRSGSISRQEMRLASKLLQKRFGIKNISKWMNEADVDSDGKVTFKEFKKAVAELEAAPES